MNIQKNTELHALNGQIVWYVNYISIMLKKKNSKSDNQQINKPIQLALTFQNSTWKRTGHLTIRRLTSHLPVHEHMNFSYSIPSGCWGQIPFQEVTIHKPSSRAASWDWAGRKSWATPTPRHQGPHCGQVDSWPRSQDIASWGHQSDSLDSNTCLGLDTESGTRQGSQPRSLDVLPTWSWGEIAWLL